MNDQLTETANALTTHCRNGTESEALDTLYDADVVSVEPMPMPGEDSAEVQGLDALRAKHAAWKENFETHSADLSGPYMHGDDRFGIIFHIDATHKATGDRMRATEFGVYTIDGAGKIVREEFFFNPALM